MPTRTRSRRTHHPPKQARSRDSLRRWLDAAEAVLETRGLDGATLPRIAKEAGLSPASIYRRFRDKDALMAAVFARFSEQTAAELETPIDMEELRGIGLGPFARQWIRNMIAGYRTRTGLVRAAVQYSERHQRAPAVRRKQELEVRSFERMVDIFMLWRAEIRHPDPRYAAAFGMVMVAFALRELILQEQAKLFGQLLPLDDERLEQELPRLFLRYLGAEEA